MSANVQLQGNTLPSVKIIDLGITVAFNQIVQITNQEFASSRDAQYLVSVGLLTELSGPPVTPTVVNLSDIDPQTFNIRPGKVELEDCSAELATMIVEGGSARGFLWTIDPDFTVSSGTLTFQNGQLVQAGVPYNLTAGSIGPAVGDRTIIGTLDIGSHVVTLRYDVSTYIPTTNEIIVGTYDITSDTIILTEQTAQEAKEILYNAVGSNGLFTATNVQATLDQLGAYFTGISVLPIQPHFKANTDIIFDPSTGHSTQFRVNGTLIGSIDDTQFVWENNTGSQFIVSPTQLFWQVPGNVEFTADGNQIFWQSAAGTNFITNDSELFYNSSSNGIDFAVNTSELFYSSNASGGFQLAVNSSELYWQGGPAFFEAAPFELAWSNGNGCSLTVEPGFFEYNDGVAGAFFEADSSQLSYQNGSVPTNILKLVGFGGSLIQTNSDLTIRSTAPSVITIDYASGEAFIVQEAGNNILFVSAGSMNWTSGSGFGHLNVNESVLELSDTNPSNPFDFQTNPGGIQWTRSDLGTSFNMNPGGISFSSTVANNISFQFNTSGLTYSDGSGSILAIHANEVDLDASVVYQPGNIGDIAGGGDIGTAASTVDVLSAFMVNQTTAAQTLTLPAPTDTRGGRIAFVNNVGSTSFTMFGKAITVGAGLTAMWNGTAWSPVGFGV